MHRPNRPEFARELRRNPPAPERVLWRRLRNRELAGWKFRRQVPLASYVGDFACVDASLIVEIDGETHVDREAYDAARSAALEALGWQVIRFTNAAVMENLEGVLQRILGTLEGCRGNPHPDPLPQAGEGE